MKKILILLLLASCGFSAEQPLNLYDYSGGLVDRVSPERMDNKFTPDSSNVNFDADAGVVYRKEFNYYSDVPLTGSKEILSLYEYITVDRTKYLISHSSNAVFSDKYSGSPSIVVQGLTSNKRMNFETALGVLYGGNGTDNEFSYNGTTTTIYTVLNSTNMVKAKYHVYYKNRMFRSGVTNYPLTVYYSEINTTSDGFPDPNPADLGDGSNWDYIPQNGDQITGMIRSVTGDYLYIFTENSIWAIIGDDPTSWRISCVNPFIGCLYGETLSYNKSDIMFLSSRGVEKFDGQNVTLASGSIDKQIKTLSQLNVSGLNLYLTTAGDWGEGSGTNIDTTTYSGSVAISSASSLWNVINSASNYSWSDVAMSDNGSVIIIGDELFYPGVYRSLDGGTNFSKVLNYTFGDGTNVSGVDVSSSGVIQSAVFKNDGLNDGYIYVSSDTGATWSKKGLKKDWRDISISDNGLVQSAVNYANGIYVSTDIGNTWVSRYSIGALVSICVSSSGVIQAATSGANNVQISTCSGLTWYSKSAGGSSVSGGSIEMSQDGKYITQIRYNEKIYISSDTGNTWTIIGPNRYYTDIEMSDDGIVQVATVANGYIYISHDYGNTWTQKADSRNWDCVAISSNSETIIAAVSGSASAIYKNIDLLSAYSGNYTSKILNAVSWGSWGTFTADNTVPINSNIEYFIKTATSSYNIATTLKIPIANGSTINTSTGTYIQFTASFTRTDSSAIPKINSSNISYAGQTYRVPVGKTYNDNYYLSVAKNSTYNDTIYVYNNANSWERYDNFYASALTLYKGGFYFGSSIDSGLIYKMEVGSTYSDVTGNCIGYYISPLYDCGKPFNEKSFKSLWLTSSADSSGFKVYYRINSELASWVELTPTLVSTRINTSKMLFPSTTKGYYIQFKISGTSYFNIRGMSLIYEELVPR